MRTSLIEKARRKPLLQVALDLIDLYHALELAIKIANAGAHIIEAGTPLIKSSGMNSVKLLRIVLPSDTYIVADIKTTDASRLEIEPAAISGADAVTVLGLSEDAVIEEALNACTSYKIALIADLIHVNNPIERASRLADLGVEAVTVHVGIDVQRRRGISAKDLLKEVQEIASTGLLVAVAGGIKPEEVRTFIESGARIVIIGSAITKSPDPIDSTKRALAKLRLY